MTVSPLGVGMTYVAGLEPQIAALADRLDVLEVEPQTFWRADPRPRSEQAELRRCIDREALARLAALPQPKLVHSVSLPVGSARPPDGEQVDLVGEVSQSLGAAWISEHLAFNRAQGPDGLFVTGFFLPPRQTWDGVEALARTIQQVKSRLPAPFAFETAVSYLRPRPDELPDGEFIAAVAERADCGILLDLHNIWTNQRNGRQSVEAFLAALPRERVVELHVAGGFEMDGYWLDAHSGLVPAPVMQLLSEVLPRLPEVRAVIFEILPGFAEQVGVPALRAQLDQLRTIWRRCAPRSVTPTSRTAPAPRDMPASAPSTAPSPQDWESTLGMMAIGRGLDTPLAQELSQDPGIAMYRTLIAEGRAGMLAGTLPRTVYLLLEQLGEDAVRALFDQFAMERPASLFGADEALAFADFLAQRQLALPDLDQLLAAERGFIASILQVQDVR